MNPADIFLDLETAVDAVEDTLRGSDDQIHRYERRIERDRAWIAYYLDRARTATKERERDDNLHHAASRRALLDRELAALAALTTVEVDAA